MNRGTVSLQPLAKMNTLVLSDRLKCGCHTDKKHQVPLCLNMLHLVGGSYRCHHVNIL